MKNKHNKRKNTAFLFECLIREMADCLSKKENDRAKIARSILKEFFGKSSTLTQDLQFFNEIVQSVGLPYEDAFSILLETKMQRELLSSNEVEKQQMKLATKMKKHFGKEVFENFVPNYKILATINQIFSKTTQIKQKVMLEKQLLGFMTKKLEDKVVLESIDNIVVKSFTNKFNEKYQTLEEEQKTLLKKFIADFGDQNVDLLIFLDKELKMIKESIQNAMNKKFKHDLFIYPKLEKVLLELDGFSKRKPDEEVIKKVLKAQKIVKEMNNG